MIFTETRLKGAYVLGLFIVGIVGSAKPYLSVWRFMLEIRAMVREVNARTVQSQLVMVPESPTQKRTWTERLVRRFLGVS